MDFYFLLIFFATKQMNENTFLMFVDYFYYVYIDNENVVKFIFMRRLFMYITLATYCLAWGVVLSQHIQSFNQRSTKLIVFFSELHLLI